MDMRIRLSIKQAGSQGLHLVVDGQTVKFISDPVESADKESEEYFFY